MAEIERGIFTQAKQKAGSAEEREQQWYFFADIVNCLIRRGHDPDAKTIAFVKQLCSTKATVVVPEPEEGDWSAKFSFRGASLSAWSAWKSREVTREILSEAKKIKSRREKAQFLAKRTFSEQTSSKTAKGLFPALMKLDKDVVPAIEEQMHGYRPIGQRQAAEFLAQYHAKHEDKRSLEALLQLAEKGKRTTPKTALRSLMGTADKHAIFVAGALMERWGAGRFPVKLCDDVFLAIAGNASEEDALQFLSAQLEEGKPPRVRYGAAMAMAGTKLGKAQLVKNLGSGNSELKWTSANGMLLHLSNRTEWDATDKRILADLQKFVGKEKGEEASDIRSILDEMVDERKRRN